MSYDYSRKSGARIDGVYMENLEIDGERVLRREEQYLKKTKVIFGDATCTRAIKPPFFKIFNLF